MVVEHIGSVDAVQRDFVADDFEINEFRIVAALHTHCDLGAFLATQVFLHIFVVDLLSKGVLTINLDELVASHDTHLFGGTASRWADDGNGVADQLEGHADALETTHKGLVGLLYILL